MLCLQTSLSPELNFNPFEDAIEFPYLYVGNTKGHVIQATQWGTLRPSLFLKSQVLPNKAVRRVNANEMPGNGDPNLHTHLSEPQTHISRTNWESGCPLPQPHSPSNHTTVPTCSLLLGQGPGKRLGGGCRACRHQGVKQRTRKTVFLIMVLSQNTNLGQEST